LAKDPGGNKYSSGGYYDLNEKSFPYVQSCAGSDLKILVREDTHQGSRKHPPLDKKIFFF
jgi:hypothetical protein